MVANGRLADDVVMTDSEIPLPPGPPDPAIDHLRRPCRGRLVAGVAAGVAEYLDLDVALVRIALVALTFLGGIGIPAYIAGWLLIPDEGAELSMAEDWLGHVHEHGGFAGAHTHEHGGVAL